MAATAIDKEIRALLPLLGEEEKTSLLSVMRSFLKLKEAAEQDAPFDIEAYNRSIDEAEAEYEKEGGYTHEEVFSMVQEQWSKKEQAAK